MISSGSNDIFDLESNVKSYCLGFPEEFCHAYGAIITDTNEKKYLDFLSGCGSLNYGHNNENIKSKLIEYIASDGIAMSLDMKSSSKRKFMNEFINKIISRRNLSYHLHFTGPTGANAIEAAIKLARKVTGRTNVVAFTNGFHGCSLGALSLTGSAHHRRASVPLLNGVTRMPYDGYFGPEIDTSAMIESLLSDPSSGVDAPAAIVLEAVQGEGGLNVARPEWLRRIEAVARRHGAMLILDEIQAGCGRTGDFFAFEESGIVPDMIVLAKGISGFGLPMSLLLLRPELDIWEPGEHNGTFRGNCHAFVTAAAAIDHYWSDDDLSLSVKRLGRLLGERLGTLAQNWQLRVKGRGLMQGIDMRSTEACRLLRKRCFEAGLLLEACGPHDEVLKLMPPLTITEAELAAALDIVEAHFDEAMAGGTSAPTIVARESLLIQ